MESKKRSLSTVSLGPSSNSGTDPEEAECMTTCHIPPSTQKARLKSDAKFSLLRRGVPWSKTRKPMRELVAMQVLLAPIPRRLNNKLQNWLKSEAAVLWERTLLPQLLFMVQRKGTTSVMDLLLSDKNRRNSERSW